MRSYADRKTDLELLRLERKIRRTYRRANKELQGKVAEYFQSFKARDAEQLALLKAGDITEEQYRLWRLAQIGRGERLEALCEHVGRRVAEASKVAAAYINDATPSILALNHNYEAYTIEKLAGNIGFTIYDERTVRRLIKDDPRLLPPARVNIRKSARWSQKKMTREVTSGILQGESLDKIAARLENVTGMERNAALRNARTSITAAQNGGRQDSYEHAKAQGFRFKKRWIATKDGDTRKSHQRLDGETVDVDSTFSNGLRYPGDPRGDPKEVYNCRCTMRTVEPPGLETEPRKMRVRDPKTGRNVVVEEMTYPQWERWCRDREGDV